VRAFSGLSQALLIATCTAKERKGRERDKERRKEHSKSMAETKSIARAKRFVLLLLFLGATPNLGPTTFFSDF
jgi:hypothetical protein